MSNYIDQVKNQQKSDGSFSDANGLPSIIYTSLILSVLNNGEDTPEVEKIREKASNFLLSQKNDDWKFAENTGVNFYALAALAGYDKDIVDGAVLAKILTGLIALESQEGGPYYLQNEIGEINKIIDPAANAAIARFLACYGVELTNLEPFNHILDTTHKVIEIFHLALTPALSAARSYENLCTAKKTEDEESKQKKDASNFDAAEQEMMDKILTMAEKRFAGLSEEFKSFALRGIKKTIKGNRDKQMSLMAYYVKQGFGKKAKNISDELVAEMGLANIFFWTAFIIYDDFWDEDEAADPHILPTANLYARHYVDFFTTLLPKDTGFRTFFHQLMDNLDGANTWETIHCRAEIRGSKFIIPDTLPEYNDYEFKFRPASGHILGSVAMMIGMGYGLDSSEVKNLISYFRNYLIAMQLNDDAHDWEEDLRRGHISTVVAMLLKDLNWSKKEIDLEEDLMELKKVFWFKTIAKAAQMAVNHTEKSRQALKAMTALENITPLERLVVLTENVAKKALGEQKKTVDFLNACKS